MAERRMFAKTIIDSDAFLEMPATSQLLYFHLSMRADDEGFVNKPKSIMRTVGCRDDDLSVLCAKGFIIPFESGIVVIKHWYIHNWIREDRKHVTKYEEERKSLSIKDNGSYTVAHKCLPDVSQMSDSCHTEVKLGKDSLGKDRIDNADKPLSDFDIAINNFKEHRKKLKKPMTPHAVELLLKELEKLAPGDEQKKIELIEYAIYRGWQGVFAKDENYKKPEHKKQEVSNADRYAITEGFKTSF